MNRILLLLPLLASAACDRGRSDAKPEPKAEAKSDAKSEAKPEVKSDAEPEPKADSKPDAKSEGEAAAKAEPGSGPVLTAEGELDLSHERVGPFVVGMSAADVKAKVGAPEKEGTFEEEGATGDFVRVWDYHDRGFELFMAASDAKGTDEHVVAIEVERTSDLELPWGLKIGSTRAEVEKIYGPNFDEDFTNDDQFVAGSVYGGTHYTFTDGKISKVFVGASAE